MSIITGLSTLTTGFGQNNTTTNSSEAGQHQHQPRDLIILPTRDRMTTQFSSHRTRMILPLELVAMPEEDSRNLMPYSADCRSSLRRRITLSSPIGTVYWRALRNNSGSTMSGLQLAREPCNRQISPVLERGRDENRMSPPLSLSMPLDRDLYQDRSLRVTVTAQGPRRCLELPVAGDLLGLI
jgi:hypothetical protein